MAELDRFDPVGTFQGARQNALTLERQGQLASREGLAASRSDATFEQGESIRKLKLLNQGATALKSIDPANWPQAVPRVEAFLNEQGVDTSQLDLSNITAQSLDQFIGETQAFINDPSSLSTAQRERGGLLEDIKSALDDDGTFNPDKADAKALSAAQALNLVAKPGTITGRERVATTEGLTEDVAASEATIAGQKKFAELSGSSRAKVIDKGFDVIQGIDKNIRNIDRAIEALNAGAGTGAIESRFFPSIKAASVALDQIQSELALDVVGATTFGALSEGELALARDVALPTKLDGPDLLIFLEDKKTAQLKLRAYYEEQIEFIDQGGTVAGFLREKRRETASTQAAEEVQTEAEAPVEEFDRGLLEFMTPEERALF